MQLRRFRDRFLLPHEAGRWFVRTYYRYSPPIADFIARHDAVRWSVRVALVPLIVTSAIALRVGLLPATAMIVGIVAVFPLLLYGRRRWRPITSRHSNVTPR